MLSALKNLKSKAQTKAKELVSTITHGGKVGKIHDISKQTSTFSGTFGYVENGVIHDWREALDLGENTKRMKQQWFPSVSNGKDFPKIYKGGMEFSNGEAWRERQKAVDLLYDTHDEETLKMVREYVIGIVISDVPFDVNRDSKIIGGNFSKEIVEELYTLRSDKIKFAALEENLDGDFIPFPVARLAIAGKDPICLVDFLEASKCKEYGVDAITICTPDENKTRGVRLSLLEDEDGKEIRSYEILNGTYDMDLNWEVEGKKCEMKISVSADGSAKILKRNGVTDEEICAHTEVVVGKEHDTKFLYEALGLKQTQGKSMERIKPVLHKRSQPQKPTSKEDAKIKELMEKNPEVKSALEEFASEVKEESSESVKPLTDITKADVKEAGSSMQR